VRCLGAPATVADPCGYIFGGDATGRGLSGVLLQVPLYPTDVETATYGARMVLYVERRLARETRVRSSIFVVADT
jgi:hypothetical protein